MSINPRLAAARAKVEQAEARVWAARAAEGPSVELYASARPQGPLQQINILVPPGRTISINRTDYATRGIGVVWALGTGGRVEAATGAAREHMNAAEADFQHATEQVLYEVGVAYFRALLSRSALAEAQTTLTSAEEELRSWYRAC